MKHRSSWWKTLIGIILTLIMLFPVYWMINISFTQRRSIRSGDLFPKDFTLENYASALSSQLPYLGRSDFMFASTLDSGGGKMRPITMGLYDFIGSQNQEWGPMMATAVLASVPTALLLIFAQKYVAAGVTAGAVKD